MSTQTAQSEPFHVLLTKREVARMLRVSIRTVEHFIAARRLAVIRLGRAVRIEPGEISRLKQSLTVKATT